MNIPSNYVTEITELVQKGLTPRQICNELNLKYVSLCGFLHTRGLATTFKKNPDKGNTMYFNEINSDAKAYILGFIAADGCITAYKGQSSLTITIHKKDECVLEFMRSEIGFEHKFLSIKRPMGFNKTKITDHIRFSICDKQIISDLKKYGIYERKSLTMGNIIENIPLEHRSSFIVGYWDGDGCILTPNQNKSKHQLLASARGTFEFLNGIRNHLKIETPISFHKTHIIHINKKKDIANFFKIYTNCPFKLERKYKKFLERIKHPSYQEYL